MERVLVTGGAGFIGSHLARVLIQTGRYQVTVLDKLTYAGNLENFPPALLRSPYFHFERGDIADRALVRKLYRQTDKVIHLAAETHIDRSIDDLDPFVQTDFVGSAVLLDELRTAPIERFVHVSTSEVYGSAQSVPMTEEHPLAPQSPYAATKAAADRLAYAYYRTYGLPIVIVRPFNNYGPNQYPEKLIPFFFTSARANQPLYVYGTGRNTRDWLYVEDTAQALVRLLEVQLAPVRGEVLNLGTGTEHSVNEIAERILGYLGRPASLLVRIKDRPGHVERLVAATDKTRLLLGWRAATGFDEGLTRTLEWYQSHTDWWEKICRRPEYRTYVQAWYAKLHV